MAQSMTKTATTTTTEKKKKKFNNDDMILCRSITVGELLYIGDKTNELYRFAEYGEEEEVEYQDLLYSLRRRNPLIMKPRFIILDKDFVEQNKELSKVYDSMYTESDLRDVLNLSVNELRQVLPQLPSGAVEAIKGLAVSGFNNGTFDSVQKIKLFDEMFGTQMLLALTN